MKVNGVTYECWHEMGHALGFYHNDVLGSLMYPIGYEQTPITLLPKERAELVNAYKN